MTTRHGADRPSTLFSLIAALAELPELSPVERARVAPDLIEAAKAVLSGVRGAAIQEAVDGGMSVVGVARELGVHRSKVTDALTAHRARVGQKTDA